MPDVSGILMILRVLVSVGVSMVTSPKPESELRGLVYSLTPKSDFHDEGRRELAWFEQPTKLAGIGLVAVVALNILFW